MRSLSNAAGTQIERSWSGVVASASSGARSIRVAFRETFIDNSTLTKLKRTITDLRLVFPEMPKEMSVDETIDRPSIFEGLYHGQTRDVVIRNIPQKLIEPLGEALRDAFAKQALPLTVVDGGSAICINVKGAYKGRALTAFATSIGVPEAEILRFGDQACPGGNDESMVVGPTGYNVGTKVCKDPAVRTTARHNALGTASVLRSKTPAEVKAIATDYDHTLTGDSSDFHPAAVEQIVRYLNGGTKIAVITGRGPSIFGMVLPKLLASDLAPGAIDNLVFALFNGSLFVSAKQAIEDLKNEEAASHTKAGAKPGTKDKTDTAARALAPKETSQDGRTAGGRGLPSSPAGHGWFFGRTHASQPTIA